MIEQYFRVISKQSWFWGKKKSYWNTSKTILWGNKAIEEYSRVIWKQN